MEPTTRLCVSKNREATLTQSDLCEFLNDVSSENERNHWDVQSIWSKVCKSLKEFRLKVDFNDEGEIVLVHDNSQTVIMPRGRKWLLNTLLGNIKHNLRLNALLSNKDQGTTFHLVSKNVYSNKFLSSRGGISFSCYRFTCKGHLNQKLLLKIRKSSPRHTMPHL